MSDSGPGDDLGNLADEFELYVRASSRRLLGRAIWRCNKDIKLAEDLTQETYLRLWKAWPRCGQIIQEHKAYSNKVLDHVIADHYRKKRVIEISEGHTGDPADPGNGEPSGTSRVRQAIGSLPAQQRELVFLVYYGNLTLAEAANEMKLSPNTAHNYHYLARNRLRAILPEPRVQTSADGVLADKESS